MKYRILFSLFIFFSSSYTSKAQLLAWNYQDLLSDIQQSGANPDLVSDANGNIYVSYWNNLTKKLGYAYRDKATHTWSISTPDPSVEGGYKSAIALDANNKVHIAYYKNVNGVGYLQYLTNKSGNWVSIGINDTIALGNYGANNFYSQVFQPSVDISVDNAGTPFIVCFDATFQPNGGNPAGCQYINYDLDILYAYKSGNSWSIGRMPDIPSEIPGYCQIQGDRYGEFLNIIPAKNGGYNIFTQAYFNRKPLMFRSNGNNLNSWSYFALDSLTRDVAAPITLSSGFESYEDICVAPFPGSDSVVMMYGFSDNYGLGGFANQARFYFSRIKHESLGTPAYGAFYKKMNATQNSVRITKFALAPHSANDVFFSYYEEQNGRIIVGKTLFAGVGFIYDTVATGFFTNSRINLYKDNDSLFVLLYDGTQNSINLAKKRLTEVGNPSIGWAWETITQSVTNGITISSAAVSNVSGDILHLAYTESPAMNIKYGNKNGVNWSYSAVNPVGTPAQRPQLALNNNTTPYIVYTEKNSDKLIGARKSGATWSYDEIAGVPYAANEPSVAIRNNTIYVSFQDKVKDALMFATASWSNPSWTISMIDSSSALTGRISDIQVDASGNIHIAYLNETQRRLMYASKSPSGPWAIEAVSGIQVYDPLSISLQVNSSGEAFVAFYDLAAAKIMFAERNSGSWIISEVKDFDGNNVQGNPVKLRIDNADRLWLLYNYPTSTAYELRMARREYGTGVWYDVSVVNNQGEIGNSFDFNIAGQDFYIFGQKNISGNSGLAYLYAENGVSTEIGDLESSASYDFSVSPNPARDNVVFSFENPKNQSIRYKILNLTGQVVSESEWIAAVKGKVSLSYHCETLPHGLYFLKWEIGERSYTTQWIK